MLDTTVLISKHVIHIPFYSGVVLLFVSFPGKISMCFCDGEAPACADWTGLRVNVGAAEPAIVNWDPACLRCL